MEDYRIVHEDAQNRQDVLSDEAQRIIPSFRNRFINRLLQHELFIRYVSENELAVKLFKNAGILFSGNVTTGILNMLAIALTARALGSMQFGILVLVTTYVMIVDSLLNFKSWQAIIKYGCDAQAENREDDLKSLIKFGFLLDGVTALLSSVIAMSAAWFVGRWQHWTPEIVLMSSLYGIAIMFRINGTPTAILRLFDKFMLFSWQGVLAALFKLSGIIIGMFFHADLVVFLLIWGCADIFGSVLLIYYSIRELKRKNVEGIISADLAGMRKKFDGLWGFLWTTNINGSLRSAIRELDVMIIGGVAGPVGSGLFKVVKTISLSMAMLADPFYAAIYPEFAKLIAARKFADYLSLAVKSSLFAGLLGVGILLCAIIFGRWGIDAAFGISYRDAYLPMLVYMFASLIWMFGFPLSASVLAFGMPHVNLYILIMAQALYFPLLYLFLKEFDILGASIAYVVFQVFWGLCMFIAVNRKYSVSVEP